MQDHWTGDSECKPMVECAVYDPYGSNSALAESQCYRVSIDKLIIACRYTKNHYCNGFISFID